MTEAADKWLALWHSLPNTNGWRVPWIVAQDDGNPAFSAINDSLARGVRCIDSDSGLLEWYVDTAFKHIRELVIYCGTPNDTVRDLLRQWIEDGCLDE